MPRCTLDDVPFDGIEEITTDDLDYAKEFGLVLKLLGVAERLDGGASVRVFPCFLYGGHPLAAVVGPFNAVTLESQAITEVTLSGPGAGGPQTASAVLGDVVSVMSSPGMELEPASGCASSRRRRSSRPSTSTSRSRTRPACWPRSRRSWARTASA